MRFPLIFLLDEFLHVVCTFSNELPGALPVIDDNYTVSLDDGTNMVTLTTVLGHRHSEEIKEDKYLFYPVDEGQSKLFRIIEVEEDRGATPVVTMKAEISAYGDLLDGVVRPTKFNSATIKEIADHILEGTEWVYDEMDTHAPIDWEISDYKTKLEAIKELAEFIKLEIDYIYIMEQNTITERKISFFEKIDNQVGSFVNRGKNLMDIKRTIYSKDVVTSMIGVGPDIDGVKLTFATLEPGDFLPPGFEKPYGADYVTNIEAVNRCGRERFGIYVDNEAKGQQELCEKTIEALKEAMIPKVKYEVNMAYININTGEKLTLGKKVYINDTTIEPKIALSARIRGLSTSIYNPTTNTLTLGDYVAYDTTVNDRIAQLQNKLDQVEQDWNKATWEIKIRATNGTTFVNNTGETTLIIDVFKNGLLLDELGGAFEYEWKRKDPNTQEYIPLSGVHGTTMSIRQKELKVLGTHVRGVAIYEGHAYVPSDYK